jgi:hypothetical protein
MSREDRLLRPFWLHQAAEYLLGLVLVATGLQSPTPVVPAVAGGLILVNAAVVDGPLGAFRLCSRRVHRIVDLVVIGLLVLLAVIPALDVDNASRAIMIGVAAILGVVWWNSSFATRASRAAATPAERSEAIGRSAGRVVGGAARAFRDRRR